MTRLNKYQGVVFLLGGLLMVAGAGCTAFMWQQATMCWVFLAGSLLFSIIQMMQSYEGTELTIHRLKRIQTLADILFVLAGLVMVDSSYGFFRPLFHNQEAYITYLYNKWVILLLIAAILEVYTVHRIDHELSKKN